MATDTQWASNIGFRHVVEDGLSVLKGEDLAKERLSYVLESLAERFESAARGFEMAERAELFFGKANQAANSSSHMLRRYLNDWQDERLPSDVKTALKVLNSIRHGNPQRGEPKDRQAAIAVLDALLKGLERDAQRRIPFMPVQEVRVRG